MYKKFTLKQLALVNRKHPILLHDSTRPHISMITHQKLHTLNYEVLYHPPYLPDFSPTDFHFFKYLDTFLQEKGFRNLKDAELHIVKYRKNAFNIFSASRTTTFYDTGKKKTCFSLEKVH